MHTALLPVRETRCGRLPPYASTTTPCGVGEVSRLIRITNDDELYIYCTNHYKKVFEMFLHTLKFSSSSTRLPSTSTVIMKGTKVLTLGVRAVAGVCMVHGWLLGP